jgi:hypothetical protein
MYKDKDPYRAKLFQDMAKTTSHKGDGRSSSKNKNKSPRLSGTFMTFAGGRNSAQTEMSRTSHNQGFFVGLSIEKDNFMSNQLFTLSKDSDSKGDTPKLSGRRDRSDSSNGNSRVK